MANDKVFGIKVTEDLNDKVKSMIESSGKTTKDWFESLITFAEIQQLKDGNSDYTQDLSELEVHTQRIYELTANMIKRASYIKDSAVKIVQEQLIEQQENARTQKEQIQAQKEQLEIVAEELIKVKEENTDLHQQVKDSRKQNENNQFLIGEMKDKNDLLAGELVKYKQYQEENEQLKEQLTSQKEEHQTAVNELTEQNRQLQDQFNQLQRENGQLIENHINEIQKIDDKHEIEKERAILEEQKEHQKAIATINENHNTKVKGLLDELEKIRSEYEKKIEGLTKKPTAPKTTPKTK